RSTDGGKTFQDDVGGIHGDHHALWIDPRDGRHMLVGNDGGLYVTYDRMQSWDRLNHVAIGQFYHVAVDSRRPYRVYGGLQDNGVWAGPSRTLTPTGSVNEDWLRLSGRDGFVCRVAPQPGRPLGRHRRRLPVGDARRGPGVDERHRQRGPPRPALGGPRRGVALRGTAGLRGLRRPPLRRRRAPRVRDDGLRQDLE